MTVPLDPLSQLASLAPELPPFVREEPIAANRSIYRVLNAISGLAVLPMLVVPFAMARSGSLPYTLGEMLLVLLPCMLLLAPVHEGVHWLAARSAGVPARQCRFGFYRAGLMPYFRALIPMRIRRYRFVLLAPGIGLTLLAAIPALWHGDLRWFLVAAVAFVSGAGDYYWFWRLRAVASDRWVWDRAGLVGVEVLRSTGA